MNQRNRTPAETLQAFLDGIQASDWDNLHRLYAEDTLVLHPLASDATSATLSGRETLRKHFAKVKASGVRLRTRDLVMHKTTDPEVVVGEFVYVVDGAPLGDDELVACFVWRVREGLIVRTHDYLGKRRPYMS